MQSLSEMHTTWDYHLIALSVIIAIFGSYIALDFAGRMKSAQGIARRWWFTGGALMMGLAIWTMHFVGMLALIMPMPTTYDELLVALSVLAAVTGSGIAFAIMNRQTLGQMHMFTGSIAMGLAISTMHYTGMASMQMAAQITYDPLLFVLSVVIAITASAAALWIAFSMRRDKPALWFWQKVGSAVVMGCAVSGMHYTGMAAARYYHTGNMVSGLNSIPTVGPFKLGDLLIVASILFGLVLLLLSAQIAAERQKALEVAQENEKRFLGTFEQAAVGIALVGLKGEWLKLNRKYCEILDYSQDELMGMTFQDITHPDDLEADVSLYRKLLAGEIDHYMMEKRYLQKDESLVWVNLTVSMVRDTQRNPLYAIAVVEDISDRKRADNALLKSKEREQMAAGIIDSIRSESQLSTILQQTVNNVGRFTQADRCLIWLYNSETGQFLSPAHEYQSSQKVTPIRETATPNNPILTSLLSQTETASFPDVLQAKDLTAENKQIIEAQGIKSLLHVPIVYKDQFLGSLRIHTVFEKREWDAETIELIQHMAAQAAVAIYHAKTLQELRESESRKSGILESSLDAIITMDQAGKICEWNTAAERILGYQREKVLGKELAHLIIPERYREAHHKGLVHYLSTGEGPVLNQLLELPALRADGIEFLSELTITRLPVAGPPLFTGTLRDITERKRTEEELQKLTKELEQRVRERTEQLEAANTALKINEERFRILVETVKDYAIFMLDPNGIILTWNKGAERLKGYQAEEIIGQSFSRFYIPEALRDGFPAYELKVASEEGRCENEGWLVRKDGSRFWANVIITALYDTNGSLVGFTKITRDLTEQKQAEAILQASERQYRELSESLQQQSAQLQAVNKELEAFSYSVSHDLRAPLRGIDGFSQALLEQYSDTLDEQGKHYLSRIRQGSQQMGKLIDDMLQLSRLTRGEMAIEPVELSTLVKDMIRELQEHEPERTVEFVIADGLTAQGDKHLLQAAIQNLLDNAWKYTSKHSKARIEFGVTEYEGKSAYFLKDDGAGFDMKYAKKLFGAFQRLHGTTEFSGTGVGLATVARIIHRHGGEIWAQAEVEKGATFYFTLGTLLKTIEGKLS